jgi:hypothetical protein
VLHSLRRLVPCAIVALAALTPAAALASGGGSTAQRHQMYMYKAEKSLSIDANDVISDEQLSCSNGDYAIDGMWRIDQVNFNAQIDEEGPFGPWNVYNGVDLGESRSFDKSTWTYTIRNNSDEDAQVHLWITCLNKKTQGAEGDNHKHTLSISSLYTDSGTTIAGGTPTVFQAGSHQCDNDQIAVAPGFSVNDGTAKIYRSYPSDGDKLTNWELGFYVSDPTTITTSVRCLDRASSSAGARPHRHKLVIRFRESGPSLPKSYVSHPRVTCDDHGKGLLGAFDVRAGYGWGSDYDSHALWFLGMEPQIKTREFHIFNHHPTADYSPDLGLVCVNDRIGSRFFS